MWMSYNSGEIVICWNSKTPDGFVDRMQAAKQRREKVGDQGRAAIARIVDDELKIVSRFAFRDVCEAFCWQNKFGSGRHWMASKWE
jgi:hypothetical protein